MRLMTHLRKLSDGTYEVRIVVPADCRVTIGKANLTRRLGRISKAEANRLAAPIVAEFLGRVETARAGPILEANLSAKLDRLIDPRSARAAIERWRSQESERLRLLIFNGLDPQPAAPDRQVDFDAWISWKAAREGLRLHLRKGEWDRLENFDERMLTALRDGGLDIRADHMALNSLRPLFASAWHDVLEAGDAARSGEQDDDDASSSLETNAITQPHTPLEQLFDGYIAERQPQASTVKRWRPVMASLIAQVGHDDASRYCAEDVIQWKGELLRDRAAKTVREVYLAALKTVLSWAVENRKLTTNVAAGITVRAAKRTVTTRERGFTKDEARTILRAATNAQKGQLSVEHWRARRWVPWLCAYTGARVGEIGQLRVCDVEEVDGVWVVRITPEAGPVKTGQARIVPIHPHLVQMGFLTAVQSIGRDGPVFYNPSRGRGGSKENPHSNKVGERLAEWVRALGINHPQIQPNHGWRHLFKTRARSAGIEPDARDAIQGHAARTEGEAYGDWPISVLAEAINRLPHFEI
jgi:integrase